MVAAAEVGSDLFEAFVSEFAGQVDGQVSHGDDGLASRFAFEVFYGQLGLSGGCGFLRCCQN